MSKLGESPPEEYEIRESRSSIGQDILTCEQDVALRKGTLEALERLLLKPTIVLMEPAQTIRTFASTRDG